jgi:hypothetical protein
MKKYITDKKYNLMTTLDQLGIVSGTDKSSEHHDYCRIYEKYFEPLRDKNITLLELGFGGHEDINKGGESMNMWDGYFQNAKLACVDISPKNDNIITGELYIGSQDDKEFLTAVVHNISGVDVIIDDASHKSSLTIKSFEILFPLLQSGGYYCVEDLHSSYHSFYYGNKEANPNPSLGNTAMNFFKRLTDEVNKELLEPGYHLGYDIEFMHFYKDLLIIKKK